MIVGLITIVTLIVMTFMRTGEQPELALERSLSVPDGERVEAFTQGRGWNAVVTRDEGGQDRIHILDPESGEILQSIEIKTP